MKSSPKMQALISRIAAKHNIDLGQSGASLTLHLKGYMPLGIECIGKNQVAIHHYFTQDGDLVFDPEVVFFTGYEEWVAISIEHSFGPQQVYAVPDEEGTSLARLALQGQARLASFCAGWASNLQEQGWLDARRRK